MPTPPPLPQPRPWSRGLPLLVALLGLTSCGDPPIILLTITPSQAKNVLIRTQVGGQQGRDATVSGLESRVVVNLPPGASGGVVLDIFGLDANGCKISESMLSLDVPGGLSRSTERLVTLAALPAALCPLTVKPGGTGQGAVISNPPGISCGSASSDGCTADFAVGQAVQLTAVPAAHNYPTWAAPCTANVTTCSVTFSQPTTQVITFTALTCGKEGFCSQPGAPPTGVSLRAIAGYSPTDALVAGDGGVILRCSFGVCANLAQVSPQPLLAGYTSDPTNIWFVGKMGTIAHCNPAAGTCMSVAAGQPAAQNDLLAVHGVDANNIYVVGKMGAAYRCNNGGGPCVQLTSALAGDYTGVWASDVNNVYIVSSMGGVARCGMASNTCMSLTSGTAQPLAAVRGAASGTVYAVGGAGTAIRCGTGSACTALSGAGSLGLTAVYPLDATSIYLAGVSGKIFRCDGSDTCTALVTSTVMDYYAVAASDAQNIYAVGRGGLVSHCAGSMSSCDLYAPTTNDLFAVSANPPYVAGAAGTILYFGQ